MMRAHIVKHSEHLQVITTLEVVIVNKINRISK
jgi:hypothetical protein